MGPAIAIPTKRNSVVISIAPGAYSAGWSSAYRGRTDARKLIDETCRKKSVKKGRQEQKGLT
jgi:hypothetical protein